MTIRSKFNIAMLAMFGVLVLTAGVIRFAVKTIAAQALDHARMREQSVFTDNIRAELFYQVAVKRGFGRLRSYEDWWPSDVLDDVGLRINLSTNPTERESWTRVHAAIRALASLSGDNPDAVGTVRVADQNLRKLRRYYDRLVADSIARTAEAASIAHIIGVAAALSSVLLLGVVTLLIRDWFVKPVAVLNQAADEIGKGNLDHRVPLDGGDEFAQIARRIDRMAQGLAEHQKQLVEAREMAAIGELCTNVAHGLRNPLAGMRAGAQLVRIRSEDPEKLRSLSDDIVAEIDRMDERITRLFEFSRTCRLERQPTSFKEIINDAEAEARGLLNAKHIQLEIQDQANETVWPIDRVKLASAVGELIANAAHHSDDGSSITVSASVTPKSNGAPSELNISVTDRGCGIQPNAMKRLFDLFYTSRPDGIGMGLPIVQRIIQEHNGTIKVSSAAGEGTRVELTLPNH